MTVTAKKRVIRKRGTKTETAVPAPAREPTCDLCAWMLEEDHQHLKNAALPFCKTCKAFRRNPNSSSKICYHCFMREGMDHVHDCPFCSKPN